MPLLFVFLTFIWVVPAWACGPDTDCQLGDRHYRIAMPDAHDGVTPVPAIVFAHGYRGTARGVMRNGSLRRLANDLGVALIATKSVGPGWDLPNAPRSLNSDGSAEYSYFESVLDDAQTRYPLDRNRIMATGFSGGGMMIWNLACARPGLFAGFAPIAGTFWKAPPETCAEPVTSIIHIHGDKDKTVPLMGRTFGGTKQGEVPMALELYEDFGGFGDAMKRRYDSLDCSERRNSLGERLDFCLFSGGHSFRTEHVRHAWHQFVKAGRL